jgi:hypothetical protein
MKTLMVLALEEALKRRLTCLAQDVDRDIIRKSPPPSSKRGKSVEAVTVVLNSDQVAFVKSLDLIIAFVLASSISKPF